MTDVVAGGMTLAKAVVNVPQSSAGSLGLLSRGTAAVRAPDFFSARATEKLFDQIAQKYDLVLIDAPPLLRVAYATTLARLADRGMVVIAHGEDVHTADELRDQVGLVGIPLIGYVYNMAPLRAEMAVSAGSMADTLGEHPASVPEKD
jgi:receptor protein-tyrosine kinase